MTQDQLKELKADDKILIVAEVDSIRKNDNVSFRLPYRNCNGEICWSGGVVIAERVSLMAEKPKHDPCRPFKEGDIVTPIERDGREVPDGAPVGEKCAVVESERNGIVCIRFDAGSELYIHEIPYFHLELVTPVEELAPYSVHESEIVQGFDIVRDKLCVMTFPYGAKEYGWYYNRIDAKEAAEAARDRLNAAYRKEQK